MEEKFAGPGVTELRRLRQLEDENQQLKKLVAELSLDKEMLQEVLKQSSEAGSEAPCGDAGCRCRAEPFTTGRAGVTIGR